MYMLQCVCVCVLMIISFFLKVLFCRLTDYQRELYEEYIKGPEVEAMMRGGKQVRNRENENEGMKE